MVLMSSFFDESEAGSYLTVGGYLFRKSKVRPFETKWGRMLKRYDVPYFRMSAVNAARPPFDKLGADGCDQLAREAIALVVEFATYGYFVAIRPDEFYEVVTDKGFAYNPYTLCAHVCLMGMRYWSEINDPNALIAYFFEAGARHQGDAALVLNNLSKTPSRVIEFRYAGHGFLLKERSMPTQAADMLAWHSSKNIMRADAGLNFPRGDFKALLDGVQHGAWLGTKPNLLEIVRLLNASAGSPAGNRMAGRVMRETKLWDLSFKELRKIVEESD